MAQIKRINNAGKDMTTGNPLALILMFSIPILIGNIFQQLYNVVDTSVIGHVLGDHSLAAIGATAAIYNLVIGFANGTTNGFAVVLATFYGKKDPEGIRKTVSLIVVLTVLISVLLTVLSVTCILSLLRFMNTPEAILKEAVDYLHIILLFSIVTMLYNMFAGMLRAIGNSMAPLVFLIVSTAVNIILDILFVKTFGMGIKGAAYATVIAQFVSMVLSIIYIYKCCPVLHPDIKYVNPVFLLKEKKLTGELLTTGLSMGLMLAIVSIGSVALQSAVNGFGTAVITAHTAARKIDDIFMLPLGTLSMASSTFVGQNYGAGKMERVKKGIIEVIKAAMLWSLLSAVIAFLGCGWMVRVLTGTKNSEVLHTAAAYIHWNIPFFVILSVLLILRSSLQATGRKIVPLMASGVELVAKFGAVGFLTPVLGYFGVCILEPIIWIFCTVMVLMDFYRFYISCAGNIKFT